MPRKSIFETTLGLTDLCKLVPKDGGMFVFNAKVGSWRTVAYRHGLSVHIMPGQPFSQVMDIYLRPRRGVHKVKINV